MSDDAMAGAAARATADARWLRDRDEIRDVLSAYFRGLDGRDEALVRCCFAEDVVAHYDGRSSPRPGDPGPARGVDALIGQLRTFSARGAAERKVTTHFMGNLSFVALAEDEARTETCVLACLALPGGTERVAVRGLRYLDRLRRTPAGWRIAERVHTLDWACEAPATFVVEMARRRTGAPGT